MSVGWRRSSRTDRNARWRPGSRLATRFAIATHVSITRRANVRTVLVPPERLKKFTDREPGVLLTDQYCPVDNLMAEVFRKR